MRTVKFNMDALIWVKSETRRHIIMNAQPVEVIILFILSWLIESKCEIGSSVY